MIDYTQGDILAAEAEALVNTVNCVGVMGRGIALHFKNAYPENFKAYAAACKRNEVQPGRMLVFETGLLAPRWIINFPTKRHWRGKSRIEDIAAGMDALVSEIRGRGIRSIAIPPLGSGLGGLNWCDIRPIIEQGLASVPQVRAIVFEPGGASPEPIAPRTPKMTPGRATLVGLVRRYLAGMMETSISLLEIHKLMYFLQEAGEPLRLRYVQAQYGPYAENLRHVLQAINGHLISGYSAAGDTPDQRISLVPGAIERAEGFLAAHASTERRFERVGALVDGFETPFGLELLATAHWVATKPRESDPRVIVDRFYAWSPRKAQFTTDQVALALDRLGDTGWLPDAATVG